MSMSIRILTVLALVGGLALAACKKSEEGGSSTTSGTSSSGTTGTTGTTTDQGRWARHLIASMPRAARYRGDFRNARFARTANCPSVIRGDTRSVSTPVELPR